MQIALFVIGAAGMFPLDTIRVDDNLTLSGGFGRPISWQDDDSLPPNSHHKVTFKDALHTVTTYVVLKLVVPTWAVGATKLTKHVDLCFKELRVYMQEMIDTRRHSETKVERHDLFSSLLDASDADEGGLKDDQLIGEHVCTFMSRAHHR